jgi:DNA polymerase-3 subunit alpha (Gram-positive type)
MFPKAHAVAYVIMAFRIAFFKVHYPEAFYAAYFTVKAEDFDADLILRGPRVIKEKIDKIQKSGSKATSKEKNLLTVLEVALEMYMRGLKFVPVDLYKSHYKVFKITENGLLPPFISLQGVGERAARNIFESRKKSKFLSIEDLQTRAKLTRTVINVLKEHGCLHGLQETNQLSFFNLAKQDVM